MSTINLARLALDANSEEDYLTKLKHRTIVDLQALDCVRHIIKRNVEKGLLPNFSNGLVDFEHLYNTVGFIGVYETMKKFGYIKIDEFGNVSYTPQADAFGEKIFEVIHQTIDEFIAADNTIDYHVNTEQVPKQSWADKK